MSTPAVERQNTLPYEPPKKEAPLKRTQRPVGNDLLKQLGFPPPSLSLEGRAKPVENKDIKK